MGKYILIEVEFRDPIVVKSSRPLLSAVSLESKPSLMSDPFRILYRNKNNLIVQEMMDYDSKYLKETFFFFFANYVEMKCG